MQFDCVERADDAAFWGLLPSAFPHQSSISLLSTWAVGRHMMFVNRALLPNYDVGKSALFLVPSGEATSSFKKHFFSSF